MFRPCIDLHEGKVKQIVGGTLSTEPGRLQTNFVSDRPAAWYAELYRRDGLKGGHVIMLGPDNETEARAALQAYPGGLQIGGGVNLDNARAWLERRFPCYRHLLGLPRREGGLGTPGAACGGDWQSASGPGPELPPARQRLLRGD